MTGTTLLIGGNGKTPSRIASRLQARGVPVLLTSRRGQSGVPEGYHGVAFDWFEESTYVKPFEADQDIDTIYLVLPPPLTNDWIVVSKRFIDFARAKGVNRYLLMGSSVIQKGGPAHGQIHAYLEEIGADFAVIRPSWFYGNFKFLYRPSINDKNELITATGTGKVGFIAEEDIADAAVDLLSSPRLGGVEKVIVGPEPFSYDEVAKIFTEVLGRKITHRRVAFDERKADYKSLGLPDELAEVLTFAEANVIANGGDERNYQVEDKVVGQIKLREFIEENKALWSR